MERIDNVEKKVTELQNHMEDIDQGVSFIETEFQEQKDKIAKVKEESISKKELELIKKEIIDLSNRSRGNNVVLHNIPEGVENDLGCENYVLKFLKETVGMDEIPDIEVAHRSGRFGQQKDGDEKSPIPRRIHVRCFRRPDRDKILVAAVKALKNNVNKYFVTDDVHPYTRAVHKQLVPVMRDMRQKNWYAYIPWSVPRVVKYRNTPPGTSGPLKTFRLSTDFTSMG